MNIKKYKPVIVIISVGIVLIIGYVIKERMFKAKKEAITKRVAKETKKKEKEELAKEFISKQLGIPQEKVPVRVYKVSRVDYRDDLPVIGTIKSIPKVKLKFQINGVVDRFNYEEGDRVRRGDIIAVLDQKDAMLEVEWATAKLRTSKAEVNTIKKRLKVMKELYETGALIEAKLEEVEAQLEAAQSKVEEARVELKSAKAKMEKTYLYAPRDGILGEKEVDEGEFVTPNDKVASLWDMDNLYAEVGIIEKDIGKIKPGMRAKVVVDTYRKQAVEFWGLVEQIFPNIETKSRTLTVRIKITSRKAKNMLLPGMFARVKVFIYSKDNAIVVPDTAVDLRSKPPEVSLVRNNKVVNKPVALDWVGTGYVVIKSGVNVGDTVVVETPALKKLKSGTPVEVIKTQKSVFE